jgi:hypothetical protein
MLTVAQKLRRGCCRFGRHVHGRSVVHERAINAKLACCYHAVDLDQVFKRSRDVALAIRSTTRILTLTEFVKRLLGDLADALRASPTK